MPVIARVGRRSPRSRTLILTIYVLLILGSITTVYPFWLMIAGSIASNHTTQEFRLIPRYLYNERALWEAHLFLKYYRYGGNEDMDWQWKMDVPGSTGNLSFWTQIPSYRPGPDEPNFQTLSIPFCVDPYEPFARQYAAIGSPTSWSRAGAALVGAHFPFALEQVRSMVEQASPFELDRYTFLKVVERALGTELGRFAKAYDEAGQPGPASPAYAAIVARFPHLFGNPLFHSVMAEYFICRKPDLDDARVRRRIDDYNDWRTTLPLALRDAYWFGGYYRQFDGNLEYQAWLRDRYRTLAALNDAWGTTTNTWVLVTEPYDRLDRRSMYVADTPAHRDWYAWKAQASPRYIRPAVTEFFYAKFLETRYGSVAGLNEAWGTNYTRIYDVPLAERLPGVGASDWSTYVRTQLAGRYMIFEAGHDLWARFLLEQFGSLESINAELKRDWADVDAIRLPEMTREPYGNPPTKQENDLVLKFVAERLPLEHLRLDTPENLYRRWLAERYGSIDVVNQTYGASFASFDAIYLPMQIVDWDEMDRNRAHVRWYTAWRAWGNAVDHIIRHKRSLWNTAVFCTAVVLAALVFNPLCAYALSRFNLPGAYRILLFLLATMAFPAEVTMIPNFLILKSFPLLRIVCCIMGVVVGGAACVTFVRSTRLVYPFVGAIIGGLLGVTIVTDAIQYVAGMDGYVSLLNTYWALILPGIASGYSIFILKGFFDSLPPELYESAVIDGAGELRIFARITLPMSTPVLAVIALWSFTAAYGSFTWALVICQDEQMWTLMVHLYQYQMVVNPAERLAALALASIPTLFVFLIAQKVILKGIILPTYK